MLDRIPNAPLTNDQWPLIVWPMANNGQWSINDDHQIIQAGNKSQNITLNPRNFSFNFSDNAWKKTIKINYLQNLQKQNQNLQTKENLKSFRNNCRFLIFYKLSIKFSERHDHSQPVFICSKLTIKTLRKVWNMFKVNNKNTSTTLMASF